MITDSSLNYLSGDQIAAAGLSSMLCKLKIAGYDMYPVPQAYFLSARKLELPSKLAMPAAVRGLNMNLLVLVPYRNRKYDL